MTGLPDDIQAMIARNAAMHTSVLAWSDQALAAARERARRWGTQPRDGLDYEGTWYPADD